MTKASAWLWTLSTLSPASWWRLIGGRPPGLPCGSVSVVFVNPARQACGALSQIAIGATLGPFAQRGLDKRFRFAIDLRSAVTGVQALDLVLFT